MKMSQICSVLAAAMVCLTAGGMKAQEPNPIPQKFKVVYPSPARATSDVREAMMLAAKQKKRVILDFGTDSCAECQVLSGFWGTTTNRAQVAEHFLLVHVNVGPKADQNADLVRRFQAPVKDGLPIVVVADGQGAVLKVSEEFRRARNESAEDLTGFLNQNRQ